MKHLMRGFTIIEIMIAIGLFTVIGWGVFDSLSSFNKTEALNKQVGSLLTFIERAKVLTTTAKDAAVYGVHFDTDAATLFKGPVYDPAALSNKTHKLFKEVKISSISLNGGGDNIIFDKLTGNTSQWGTITIVLRSDQNRSRTITIYGTGTLHAD